ncbi:MAG: M3 family metallopeptidase [Puniceicoccales bacterium]|jgi:oligopeptidase A|nr:M3 family metallopeptidase [Puniceicoccales bacterium]
MNVITLFLFLKCSFLQASAMEDEKHPFLVEKKFIDWQTLSTAYVIGDVRTAIEKAQRDVDAIAALPKDSLTFENTILALEHGGDILDIAWDRVSHLNGVCDSDELREAYNTVLPEVVEFGSNIILNDALWERVKAYSESKDVKNLSPIDKRLLQRTVDGFLDGGADLPREQRERLKQISLELSQKAQKFSENCLDSRNAWEKYVDNAEILKGLPKIALDILAADAKRHGHSGYRLSLDAPSLGPCMQYLDDDNLRKELFEASLTVGRTGKYNNSSLIEEILKLRDERAKLLGHKTHADMVLQHRMAKNGKTVLKFIEDLHGKSSKYFLRDVEELRKFIKEYTGDANAKLRPWNASYYSEKLRQKKYDFESELLRPYFKMENVISGLFEIVHRLYGIKIFECKTFFSEDRHSATPSDEASVWHKDVKFYDIFDETGAYIGSFYADWYPRKPKRGGAWANDLFAGGNDRHGHWQNPVGVICGNLTPSTESSPSLLTHYEVETIFHEFGHLMHHMFGKVKHKSLNGMSVAWDFVEMPSQIMENFCWDRSSLDLFARHYQTGEKIPDELFNKMLAARNHQSGMAMMGQLCLAKLDLELHHNYKAYKNCDIEEKLSTVLKPYRVQFEEKVPTIMLQFSHIFSGGYSAGYYSYKWAEVLDADAFTRFHDSGVLSEEIGSQFRQKILSQGDSVDADVLYRNFMGRDPKLEPLLIRSGLYDK